MALEVQIATSGELMGDQDENGQQADRSIDEDDVAH
jgi:hypothetical protein